MRMRTKITVMFATAAMALVVGIAASAQNLEVKGQILAGTGGGSASNIHLKSPDSNASLLLEGAAGRQALVDFKVGGSSYGRVSYSPLYSALMLTTFGIGGAQHIQLVTGGGGTVKVGNGTYPKGTLSGVNIANGGNSYLTVSDNTRQVLFGADSSNYGMVGTYSNHDFVIRTNNAERVRVAAGGKFGIGTTAPAYKMHVEGDIFANLGWLRTSGNTGWYSETWGGGWYMQDSTWIRSYNEKPVYMNQGFDTGAVGAVGCGGGMAAGYNFRVCGTAKVTSSLTVDGIIRGATYGFGGFYQWADNGYCATGNPYTGACSCPGGFTAYQSARLLHPEWQCGSTQYQCVR